MRNSRQAMLKWLTPGLWVKRWLLLLLVGVSIVALGLAQLIVLFYDAAALPDALDLLMLHFMPGWARVVLSAVVGLAAVVVALYQLNQSVVSPLIVHNTKPLVDVVYDHNKRQHGLKVVAVGGGTGLPSVLRGMKVHTSNITAIVTVADDGGSSGKLRRELGVLPPGDLRNNIAALANDESLITQLFQYRFSEGGLEGHSFGNLFLTAIAEITGGMDRAVAETGRVLAIQGEVLPATLQDNVVLGAEVRISGENRLRRVNGESQISKTGGKIERVFLQPDHVRAFPGAVRAILNADLIVIGPGSLYTSILPSLLVDGIVEAIRASSAVAVYVCNVATQNGETDDFSVADHVLALETHIGQGVFDVVLANDSDPIRNAGQNTHYVLPTPANHAIFQRYQVRNTEMSDAERPWRHDPKKLAQALLMVYEDLASAWPDQIEGA